MGFRCKRNKASIKCAGMKVSQKLIQAMDVVSRVMAEQMKMAEDRYNELESMYASRTAKLEYELEAAQEKEKEMELLHRKSLTV